MSVLVFWQGTAPAEVTATPAIAAATATGVARTLQLETTPVVSGANATGVARSLQLETTLAVGPATATGVARTLQLESAAAPATASATGPALSLELATTPAVGPAAAAGVAPATSLELSATPVPATATASGVAAGLGLETQPTSATAVAGLVTAVVVAPALPLPYLGAIPAPLEARPTELRVTPDPAEAYGTAGPVDAVRLEADQAPLWPTIQGELPAIPSRYRDGPSPSAGYLQALRSLDPDLPRVVAYSWPPRRPLRENEQLAAMEALDGAIDKGRTRVALAGAPGAAMAVDELVSAAVRAIVTGQPSILEAADLTGAARAISASIQGELEYLHAFGAATVTAELGQQERSQIRKAS